MDLRKQRVRRTALVVVALTAVNVVIVLLAGYGTLHWMESPSFCGQTCHTPMHPQFTAWQNAPHSQVACTQCHIGEGARALVHYKLAGVRMLVHVVTGNYPRPIPASIVDLRPAIETCGNCHTATLGLGQRSRIVREYADDEANSETDDRAADARGRARDNRRRRDEPSTGTPIPRCGSSTSRPMPIGRRFPSCA